MNTNIKQLAVKILSTSWAVVYLEEALAKEGIIPKDRKVRDDAVRKMMEEHAEKIKAANEKEKQEAGNEAKGEEPKQDTSNDDTKDS